MEARGSDRKRFARLEQSSCGCLKSHLCSSDFRGRRKRLQHWVSRQVPELRTSWTVHACRSGAGRWHCQVAPVYPTLPLWRRTEASSGLRPSTQQSETDVPEAVQRLCRPTQWISASSISPRQPCGEPGSSACRLSHGYSAICSGSHQTRKSRSAASTAGH